jgi:transposase
MSMSAYYRGVDMEAKRNSEKAVKRRVRAGRLLLAGKSPPEVAKMIGAPRQTVYRWRDVLEAGGIDALREMSGGGRPPQLGAGELSRLYVALLEGPEAHGFNTPLWTLKRVRMFIEREFGVRYSEVHVWRLLGQLGLSNQKPDRRALERDEAAIEHWRKRTWPALKKTPLAKQD